MEHKHIKTCSQGWAERAYKCVSNRAADESGRGKYCGFAKRFPSLIHTCGLAQALAFAGANAPAGFVADLEIVLGESGLGERSRKAPVPEYLRLSRKALQAAGWLKRYAEALLDSENGGADASLS